jgi:hypothetical protein
MDERDRRSIERGERWTSIFAVIGFAIVVALIPLQSEGASQQESAFNRVMAPVLLFVLIGFSIWRWTSFYFTAAILTWATVLGSRLRDDSLLAWRFGAAAVVGWLMFAMAMRMQSRLRLLPKAERQQHRAKLKSVEVGHRYQAAIVIFAVILFAKQQLHLGLPLEVSSLVIDAAGTVLLIDVLAASGQLWREFRLPPEAGPADPPLGSSALEPTAASAAPSRAVEPRRPTPAPGEELAATDDKTVSKMR